jgi:hypothetical protein
MAMLDRRKPAKLNAEALEDWLRHARERAANLHYLAISPDSRERARALSEMSTALRDALERVRMVSEQLMLVSSELRSRLAPLADMAEGGGELANGCADAPLPPKNDVWEARH